ncbi:dTMP kinase [Tundrisphaera lichenicola]|uniref:dTMP kinase n=1 Tax=Tundrisphaera lichenicola TaxID=2029860 RepID=UPI003EBB9BC6
MYSDPGPPVTQTTSQPGRFIVLEGPDGGGKTTQAARLADWLRSSGLEVVACREPGGTALGERIRTLVKEQSNLTIGMKAEMLLFMASRAQLVEEVIRPAIARGAVVIADRFLLSNVVYQGYAGGLDIEDLWRVGLVATGGLMPDLTLIVDVPPEIALARVGPARDRIEDRGEFYRDQVRMGFLQAARDDPDRAIVVDGSLDADSVAARLQIEVTRALAFDPRS